MAQLAVSSVNTRKRDLSDVIANISPQKTPMLNMLTAVKAINTLHETQKDELAAAAENAHNDGAAWVEGAETPPTVDTSYVQNFLKWIVVSDTLQDVQIHGMKKAYKYFSKKRLAELGRDVERAITIQVPQGPAEPRKLSGMTSTITTNVLNGAGTAPLTEERFNNLLEKADDEGGEPEVVLTNAKQKRVISGFTGGATKNVEAKSKKLIATVEVYESDFGVVRIVRTRYLASSELLALQLDLWELAWLHRIEHLPLPKDGDRTRGMIRGRLALGCNQEKGNAYYKGLTY